MTLMVLWDFGDGFRELKALGQSLGWGGGRGADPDPALPPGDMYSQDGDADEPEWVKTEREQFVEFRDKNRDGKMDKEETKDWILPSDYDHAEAEARHLVYESDQDKVGQWDFGSGMGGVGKWQDGEVAGCGIPCRTGS